MKKARGVVITILYGILFSTALILGECLYLHNTLIVLFEESNIIFTLIKIMLLTGIIVFIFYIVSYILGGCPAISRVDRVTYISSKIESFCKKYKGLMIQSLLFISWLPCYISYFPGVFSYDSFTQTKMAMGARQITSHHPPLHTLVLKIFLKLGEHFQSFDLAVALYSITQMLLLSFMITRLILKLADMRAGIYLIFVVMHVMLNPVIALFSFSITKDIYFAISLLGLFIEIINWIDESEKKCKMLRIMKMIFWSVLCCMFRNNFVYAWIISIPIMSILIKKKFFYCGVISVILTFAVVYIVYPICGVQPGASREMLCVPMQQMSNAFINHELSSEEIMVMDQYIEVDTICNNYNPRFADPIKSTFNSDRYDENPIAFWKLWIELLKKYPTDYLDAFLLLNIPYWYQGANPNDHFSQRIYIETDIYNLDGSVNIHRRNLLPNVNEFYETIAAMEIYEKLHCLKWIFSLATPIWLMLASVVMLIIQEKEKYIACMIPLVLFWTTYMAGPVSNARYIFPFMVFYPALIVLPFVGSINS